jgi:ubiquinone biosynthesis protein COQ4
MNTFLGKLKFLKFFFGLVEDPNRTVLVFKILDQLLKDDQHPGAKMILERAMEHRGFVEMLEKRYQPAEYDIDLLAQMRPGTLGHAYGSHMKKNGLKPDFYPPFRLKRPIDYFSLRASQVHDIWHVVTGYGTDVPGELFLQGFTLAQFKSPLSATLIAAGLLHVVITMPTRLFEVMDGIMEGYQRGKRAHYLLAEPLEEMWGEDLGEVRMRYGIQT